jgi:hypothetical protein
MDYELIGFAWALLLAFSVGAALSARSPFPRGLVLAAVAFRVVGSLARYDMIRAFYGGVADAARYFAYGHEMAKMAWNLDPHLLSYDFWFGGPFRWWGTPFMEKTAGVVITFVGPSLRGAYLAYSMLAFLGLYLIALTVYRNHPGPGAVSYAAWLWLWPSLWFWPSSIGKEAVSVLAIGLAFYGFASRPSVIRWVPFLAGMALAFALRPHVGAVIALASAGAYWLQSWVKPGPRKVLEAIVAAGLAVFVLSSMATELGIEDPDLEGVQEYVDFRGGQTLYGGSSLEALPHGALALPMAVVNIWLRPFPWDVHNIMAAFSALEVLLLWWFVWRYRRQLREGLHGWWRNRLIAFSVPFLFGYTVMIGLTFANLGIIARQRSPLFPFVFLLLTAAGTRQVSMRGRRRARPTRRIAPSPAGDGRPPTAPRSDDPEPRPERDPRWA